jgi:hypothetical protein
MRFEMKDNPGLWILTGVGVVVILLALTYVILPDAQKSNSTMVSSVSSSKIVTLTSQTTIKDLSIGETVTKDNLKITVNGKQFTDKITKSGLKSNGQEYTLNLKPTQIGNQFLILDITVEDLQSGTTQVIGQPFQFSISDANGYSYPYSYYTDYLDQRFSSVVLSPGQKNRGYVAFEVPTSPNELQFIFKFNDGNTALITI